MSQASKEKYQIMVSEYGRESLPHDQLFTYPSTKEKCLTQIQFLGAGV